MGKPVFQYIEGDNIYACKTCGIHLTAYNELISKVLLLISLFDEKKIGFQGTWRKGVSVQYRVRSFYPRVFRKLGFIRININLGQNEDRMLLSGLHTVCDIFCKGCLSLIGWKYVLRNF